MVIGTPHLSEVLAYEIASNYMPSPKSTYSNVYVNGTHLDYIHVFSQ